MSSTAAAGVSLVRLRFDEHGVLAVVLVLAVMLAVVLAVMLAVVVLVLAVMLAVVLVLAVMLAVVLAVVVVLVLAVMLAVVLVLVLVLLVAGLVGTSASENWVSSAKSSNSTRRLARPESVSTLRRLTCCCVWAGADEDWLGWLGWLGWVGWVGWLGWLDWEDWPGRTKLDVVLGTGKGKVRGSAWIRPSCALEVEPDWM